MPGKPIISSSFSLNEGAPIIFESKAGQKRKLQVLGESVAQQATGVNKQLKKPESSTKSPADYVFEVFKDNGFDVKVEPLCVKFIQVTDTMIASYAPETLKAARSENLEKLREMHSSGTSMNCCNRFGESLVHLACRRGSIDMVRFLIKEAGVSPLIRDDYGRTVLHDACWTPEPKFELVDFLIKELPELLCIPDVRGHTPFSYVRREHWGEWTSFLSERKDILRPRKDSTTAATTTILPRSKRLEGAH
jgi:hypothetical protein